MANSNTPSSAIDFDWNGWNDPLNPFVLAGGTLIWNGPGSVTNPIMVDSSAPNSPCLQRVATPIIVSPIRTESGNINELSTLEAKIKSKLHINKLY
nr:hypothetical protein [Cressdnaviricota sp.]